MRKLYSGWTLIWALFAICALIGLVGCAALGLQTPATFNQKLLVGYETVAEVRSQATNLLVGKKITADDAENVQKQADNARGALDIARNLKNQGNPVGADAKLDATRTALVALQTYLASREGK